MKNTDCIREYKLMMKRSKSLQKKLYEVLAHSLSHNYGNRRNPVSFDIYRFKDILAAKGFALNKFHIKIVEKGYICTITTRSGYDIVIRHDHNWKAHVHFLVDNFDYSISYYDESHIADTVIAIDDMGDEHMVEKENVNAFLNEFHATPAEKVNSAYHAGLVSNDRNYRTAAVDVIINKVINILVNAGHKAELSGRICSFYANTVRYELLYDSHNFRLIFDPAIQSEIGFRFESDCRYIDEEIKFCTSFQFKYETPENIATYIEKLYSFVNHLCLKGKKYVPKWKPVIDGTLEMVCYRAHIYKSTGLGINDIFGYEELIKDFSKEINKELARFLAILDDFKYDGTVHLEELRDKLGYCQIKKNMPPEIVLESRLPFWFSPDRIREILLHELCHTRHISHSPMFWNTVEDMLCRVGLIPEDERRIKTLCSGISGIIVEVLPRCMPMYICPEHFHFVYSCHE